MKVRGYSFIALFLMSCCMIANAQKFGDKPVTLSECINYAKENNLSIKKAKLNYEGSKINNLEAKSAIYPDLSFSSDQNYSHYATEQSPKMQNGAYTGVYGINSSMMVFSGGKLRKNIKKSEKETEIARLNIFDVENNITNSIIQAYIQILYDIESVKILESSVALSKEQLDRADKLLKAELLSKREYAQLESQYSSFQYDLIDAYNTLRKDKFYFRQLLELEKDPYILEPKIDDEDVLSELKPLSEIISNCFASFPSIAMGKEEIEVAKISKNIAKTSFYPSIGLSAGINTGHSTNSFDAVGKQLKSNLYETIGFNIHVPILNRRENKSAIQRSNLAVMQAELNMKDIEKELKKTIEILYLDATNNQKAYEASKVKLKYAEINYRLAEEKFDERKINSLDFLTAKDDLLSVQQDVIRVKYQAVMSRQLLLSYQYLPLDLKFSTSNYKP